MICLFHHSSRALAVASICTLVAVGCAKTKVPERSGAKAEAAAKAKAEQIVKPVVPPATEQQAAEATAAAPTVAELITTLAATTDSDARVLVIDEIGAVGQNALPALDVLVATFADPEPRVRWHSARAVGLIGEDARSAIPAVLKLLDDTDGIVVTQAAAALAAIRQDDGREQIPAADAALYASALEPLAKTAVHPDPRARRAAVRALRQMQPALSTLAPLVSKQLADADPAVVVGALHTLADMGDEAVPFLLESMKDPKSRYWAEVALAEIGPEAAPATEVLAKAVAEGEPEERLQAILALSSIGEKASAAAPAIATVLESDDPTLRFAAAFALGRMKAAGCDECLAKAAASADPFLASVAAWARARINPADKPLMDEAVSRLRNGLASPKPEARSASISGLSDLAEAFDPEARQGLAGDFIKLLADPDPEVGQAAGGALIRLGPAAEAPLQAKLADPAVRPAILEILAALGPAAKPAVGDLVALLADADPQTRGDAAVALASIGADAAEAVPALQKLIGDASEPDGVRYAAVFALGRIGPASSAAEPMIRELTQSKDELMATVAVWAALKIKPDDKSLFEAAVPLLRRALRGDREMARLEAAVALGDIGPAAATAIPILELVAEDDPAKSVRTAAAAALEKIKGK
jgi:HEAT repeat protein